MLMKVHNKGQVVIPAEIRRQLGISLGDLLEVELIPEEGRIELRRTSGGTAADLAGSLAQYGSGRPFPTRDVMSEALRQGLLEDR